MNKLLTLFLVVLMPLSGIANSAALPVSAFGRLPAYSDITLSRNGSYMAAKLAVEGEYILGIFELPLTPDSKAWYKRYDDGYIDWIRWANDERLLVSVRFPDVANGIAIAQTRLISIRYDGDEPANMVALPRTRAGVFKQIRDNVLSMLPDDPDHILIGFTRRTGYNYEIEVRKVNVNTGKSSLVQNSYDDIGQWIVDRDGIVRLGFGLHTLGFGIRDKTVKMIVRDSEQGEWRDISHRFMVDGSKEFDETITFRPLGFDRDPNILYVLSNHGSDSAAVYRYDIAADEFREKVHGRANVDFSGLVYDSTGHNVVGITYVSDELEIHYVEQEIHYTKEDPDARIHSDVSKLLQGANVNVVSATYDNTKQILSVSGGQNQLPISFHLLDKSADKIDKIGDTYPEIPASAILPVIATSYKARDGLQIPAYVTLPATASTLDEARALPFIILPHGGPYARDFNGFDYLAQFLASRGYGVLQINFRGSTGYGQSIEFSGTREYGQAMQDDLSDSVNWLTESGYADGDRICIVGWSYGAYFALTGSMNTPNLYQCAVGIGGVYDLERRLRFMRNFVGGNVETRRIRKLWSDEMSMAENSPVEHAEDILIPVLLMHATDDRELRVVQSRAMRDALEDAGRTVGYFEFDSGGHSLITADRVTMLTHLESFLATYLKE